MQGRFAGDARERLSATIAGSGSGYTRGRALNQAKLASLVMATGDPAEVVDLGEQALDGAGAVHSHRVADNLQELSRLAQPHRNRTDVAELRTRLAALTHG